MSPAPSPLRKRANGALLLALSAGLIHAGGTPAQECAAAKSKAPSR